MNYDVSKLFMGVVSYQDSLDVHVLCNDMNCEMLLDLNNGNSILPKGKEARYYKKSLIPFKEVVFRSKINFNHLNEKEALKVAKELEGYYFKLLRYRHIETIEDLEDTKKQVKVMKI